MAIPDFSFDLPGDDATERLAEDVAVCLRTGDTIALHGDLGTGKTTFARALIRALAGNPALEVPSPTFTLVQTYELPAFTLAHIDLYRVRDAAEIEETGLLDATTDGVAVIEWPERASDRLPEDRLDVRLAMAGTGRHAALCGTGDWAERLARTAEIRAFLNGNRFGEAHRAPARTPTHPTGVREEIALPDGAALLIDRGEAADDRDFRGLSATSAALRSLGLSAPEILEADHRRRLMLIEDLSGPSLAEDGHPVLARYLVAVEALAEIHFHPRPRALPLGRYFFRIPDLAGHVMEKQALAFADQYLGAGAAGAVPKGDREEFSRLWWSRFERLVEAEQNWLLEPVGSATLSWLPQREALRRIGFTDPGRIRCGAVAHDLAALCNDSGVTIPADLEADLKRHYVGLRQASSTHFDSSHFAEAYAIAAALRASAGMVAAASALKAQVRGAADDLARQRDYLHRALAHPVMSDLAVWYEGHLSQRS